MLKRVSVVVLALVALLAVRASAQDERVTQERARRDLLDQKTFLLVQHYLENARTLEERLDFAGAESELEKARALDPTNRVVLDTLRQVQALQGKPEAEARAMAVSAAQRYEAQRQQMKVLALTDLAQAQRLLAQGDAEQAAQLARGVANQIEWTKDSVEWGDIAPRAQQLLQQAETMQASGASDERRAREAEAYAKLQAEETRLGEQKAARVDSMLEAAASRYLRNDFDGATELAKAVLKEDPRNVRAQELIDAAREAGRADADRDFLQKRREEIARWHEAMEAIRIPNKEILTGPDADTWAALSARRLADRAAHMVEHDAEADALRARLATTRMDVDFQQLTMAQVANNIYFTTDIPVSVDPAVTADLDSAAEYVTITGLHDLPVESVLNILVEQVGQGNLAWTIRNGRVYITKKDNAQGKTVVLVHNIQDLTFPITDFKGTNIRDIPLPGKAGDDNETTIFNSELDRVKLIEPDEVLNLVKENIARESWDTPGHSIDFVDQSNLLVIHTPEVQQQVAAFLDDLRTFSTSMVTLEARFFALTDAFIEEIGTDLRGLGPDGNLGTTHVLDDVSPDMTQGLDNNGDGTGNPNAGGFFSSNSGDQQIAAVNENMFSNPLGKILSTIGGGAFQFTFLGDDELNVVITAIQKSRNASEISSPIVSVYNTQRAFVTVVNQVSFVQGYDVDVANAAFIADPNVGVVQEGIVLDVRPTISFDRKYITLDVQTTVASLARPIREVTTNLGGDTSAVTFSLPELSVQDAQTTVVVPDGGSVVLGGMKHVMYQNRTAEAPWFADIPILGFFFREKGLSDEMTDLIIVIKATITDYSNLQAAPVTLTAAGLPPSRRQ